jgi:hypothetical protein
VTSMRKDWNIILEHAASIVRSYSTRVTLRQLFYRLVADQTLRNTRSEYGQLSAKTAQARRDGWFPALMDRTRDIERWHPIFTSPGEAKSWLQQRYRRDRTEGQTHSIYLAVEKAGIVNQLDEWFGRQYGIPILPLGGYSSQTFVDEVVEDVETWPANFIEDSHLVRPSVLIYAGDFDPSGEDIDRDFQDRTSCWDNYHRVALSPEQVEEYDLPPAMGKATDSRASQFIARHGELVQVELDAIPPDTLRDLYWEKINEYWDMDTWQAVMDKEAEERASLGT